MYLATTAPLTTTLATNHGTNNNYYSIHNALTVMAPSTVALNIPLIIALSTTLTAALTSTNYTALYIALANESMMY